MTKLLPLLLLCAASLPAQPLSLSAKSWSLDYAYQTSGNGIKLSNSSGGLTFSYPSSTTRKSPSSPYLVGEWAGYLHTAIGLSLSGSIIVAGNIAVTGSPTFNYTSESFNTCVSPATLRPYFKGTSPDGDGRWWSNPIAIPLQSGPFQIIVPIDPAYWSNANGQIASQDASTLALFDAARTNVFEIGATNGGGCFFGHGVNVSGGAAALTITQFAVNQ